MMQKKIDRILCFERYMHGAWFIFFKGVLCSKKSATTQTLFIFQHAWKNSSIFLTKNPLLERKKNVLICVRTISCRIKGEVFPRKIPKFVHD